MQAFGGSVGLVGSPQAVPVPWRRLRIPSVSRRQVSEPEPEPSLATLASSDVGSGGLLRCRRASSDIAASDVAAGLDPGPVAQSVRAHA